MILLSNPIEDIAKQLELLQHSDFIQDNPSMTEQLEHLQHRLADKSFKLVVVGEISSGKSTFLNALIAKDLLTHGSLETTATITEIENHAQQTTPCFDVYYNNNSKKTGQPYELLKEYTTTSSKEIQVAEEIQRVIIKSAVMDSEIPLRFVDTPGFNGTAEHHREKTIEEIQTAHACIYMIQVRGLSDSDRQTLLFLKKHQKNFLFVQNFIDELEVLEGETAEKKVAQQRSILEQDIFTEGDICYDIVGISAQKALVGRDEAIARYKSKDCNPEMRAALYEESNFTALLEKVQQLVTDNLYSQGKDIDTVAVGLELLSFWLDSAQSNLNILEEHWALSAEGKAQSNYQHIYEKVKESRENSEKKLLNFIASTLKDSRKYVKEASRQGISSLEDEVMKELEKIKTLSNLEDFADYQLNQQLQYGVIDLLKQCQTVANQCLMKVVQDASLRISEYAGQKVEDTSFPQLETIDFTLDPQKFNSSQNLEISRLKKELQNNSALQANKEQTIKNLASKEEEAKKLYDSNLKNINAKKQEQQNKLRQMGQEPSPQTTTRWVETRVSRGGFGLLDFCIGKKKVTKQVTETDDSNVRAWRKQVAELKSNYQRSIQELEGKDCRFLQRLEDLQQEKRSTTQDAERQERKVARLQKEIAVREESSKLEKEKARQEYFISMKKQLSRQISEYLESASNLTLEHGTGILEENQNTVEQFVLRRFQQSMKQRLDSLQLLMTEQSPDETLCSHKEDIKRITETISKMEEFLCQF